MNRSVLIFAALAACTVQEMAEVPPVDSVGFEAAQRMGDRRVAKLVRQGHIELDLGKGIDDDSVRSDARHLLTGALDGLPSIDFEAGHHISLTYLGKGESDEMKVGGDVAMEPLDTEPTDVIEGIDAFNPGTGNTFRLVLNADLLDAVGERDAALGLDLASDTPRKDIADDMALSVPPSEVAYSLSNDDDDRSRLYGFNANVTNRVHRRLVQLGGGCSGTLVGPRHVVTAGHCLWSRSSRSWSDHFWVRAGANGTSEVDEVFVDASNIPSGQSLWYFTPSQYRATSGSTWGFDYGILVLPDRLGDTVGWLGRVTYGASALQNAYIYRRGYPVCQATNGSGVPRIDEPSPCSSNHLYGNTADCSVGEYQSQDSDGWSRVVHHSCDASAGDSGSPLYVYHNGSPAVAAVHFYSHCETTAGARECTGTWEDRPLGALRLTPEYRNLIGYFRGQFP